MKKYRFEIQALQIIEIEGKDADDARDKIVNEEVDSILNNSCRYEGIDAIVSDGKEINN